MFKLLRSPELAFSQRGKVSVYVFAVSHLCTAFRSYRKMWKTTQPSLRKQVSSIVEVSVFPSSLFMS